MAALEARSSQPLVRQPWLLIAALAAWLLLACVLGVQHIAVRAGASNCLSTAQVLAPAGSEVVEGPAAAAQQLGPAGQPGQEPPGDAAEQQTDGGPDATPIEEQGGADSPSRSRTWQSIDEVIRRPAALHGLQRKGGMPADWPKMLAHMTNRNAELHGLPGTMGPLMYRWFAGAYTFNKTAGDSNRDLQSPVPCCHFYADHKYRLLYVRTTKTAGTTISNTLGVKENPSVCKYSPHWCYAKCKGKQVCLAYVWDPEELKRLWAQYTVFTFVRNPWARAISSWHHIHNRGLKPDCQDSFPKFAESPAAYGVKCLDKPYCCKQKFGWVLEHVEPQAPCMFDAEGRPAVDFIGRVEHLEEDMQALLLLINSKLDNDTQPLRIEAMPRLMVGSEELQSEEEARQRAYAELYTNNTALDDIRGYYHQDFEQLQFADSFSR